MSLLPKRKYDSEEEQRLHDALERTLSSALSAVDAATRQRTAPNEAKRLRSIMRTKLQEAANAGMDAMTRSLDDSDKP